LHQNKSHFSEISRAPIIEPIADLYDYIPDSNIIAWRDTIWKYAFIRSLEIWKTLPKDKIETSLGGVTNIGMKSLAGKLDKENGKSCRKLDQNKWTFIKFIETSKAKFKPLSERAIAECKKRAREFSKL